jgi:arylsulfatase A-like enzyme
MRTIRRTGRELPRRALLALAFAVLAGGCSREDGGSGAGRRPVVVLITLDTTRADHLSCYGYEESRTSPRIDGLAAEGVLFTNAIAQAAVTPVSHASIFTGLNPYNHGLRTLHGGSQNQLEDSQVTLAEILRDVGYETGAFVSAFPVTEYFGFTQGFDHFDADFAPADVVRTNIRNGTVNTGSAQRGAGLTTARALEWMEQREGPFFLWLHYFDPHDEVVLPPPDVMQGVHLAAAERERRRQVYDVEITYMDAMIGRVFDKLEQLGLWDDCIVVITADHGEGLGDHDWWTHGILYQEQIRVPLILRAPGFRAGLRLPSVVRTIDIVPTVGDLLGLAPGELPPMDGVSLVPLLKGEREDLGLVAYSDSVDLLVYRTSEAITDHKTDMLFALVLDNRWKYIHHLKQPDQSELYDLKSDPRELVNLAAQRPELVTRANAELKQLRFMPFKQLQTKDVPPEVIENLKKLGYIGAEDE